MSEPTSTMPGVKCPYCRVPLDDNGAVLEGKHDPGCADRPLEQSELKKLFAYRDRSTSASHWSPWVPVGEDLLTVLNAEELRRDGGHIMADLLAELAALTTMSDANRSVPTDRGRRGSGDGMPSFDPAAAQRELRAAANRLRAEYEKLAGVVRNPHRSPEPKCVECGRRASRVDSYCPPCAAGILKQYRRHKNAPATVRTSGGSGPT